MSNRIAVSEQFYSIQGEGPNAGAPAVFLRLAGCNLCCGGRENYGRDPEDFEPEDDATWVCDTIDVWREPDARYGPEQLVEEWEARGWLDLFEEGAHLVLTGGEPMAQQESLVALLDEVPERQMPFIEMETNGTFAPDGPITSYVNLFNISLKLSNSGMLKGDRINKDALKAFRWVHEHIEETFIKYKFVVSREEDVDEIVNLIRNKPIPDGTVSVMPAGSTQEQLRETYPEVAELAMEKGWTFSPRLHVDAWNQATGV